MVDDKIIPLEKRTDDKSESENDFQKIMEKNRKKKEREAENRRKRNEKVKREYRIGK